MFNRLRLSLMLPLTAVALMAGCKAAPAPDSGFLENPKLLSDVKRLPFDRSYWEPNYQPADYTEIMIAPVNMDYVMAQSLWEKATVVSLNPNVKQDIGKIGEYAQQSFIKAVEKDPQKHFKIVQTPGPKTLILETALVQIVPSKAELNAVGIVFWEATAFEFVSKTASKSEDAGKGVVAIEGRVRDGGTGKVIAMFADRERPKEAIINLKAITWWEPAKSVIDQWAKEFVEVSNAPTDKTIKRPGQFELLIF